MLRVFICSDKVRIFILAAANILLSENGDVKVSILSNTYV